ncbi:MAG: polysulfide reductase NrfD [Acidobacteriaceae bacterium]|nr:polysulfide reductase NrfD [Acidobacteriaceae bacterium]
MSGTAVRYKDSVQPVRTDSRDIDRRVAVLTGEAADQQASGTAGEHAQKQAEVWRNLPQPEANDPTYYDRPLLNEPVWKWAIPTYDYIGGLTGAALVLGAAAQIGDTASRERLIRRCHRIGFAGVVVSAALLVEDLGKPSRVLNMLRVFRPTSVMNMGAWILMGSSVLAFGAFVLRPRKGRLRRVGQFCGYAAGVFGAALATYTGVLTGNTAVPLWQASRKILPILFGVSAMSSVGTLFELTVESAEERRLTKLFGTVGQTAELAAEIVMERQAAVVPRVARPLHRGLGGFLWRSAMLLTGTGLLLGLTPRHTRNRRIVSGLLGTLGSVLMRFTVEHVGTVSARDARASFHQQRAGYGAAEVTGRTAAVL